MTVSRRQFLNATLQAGGLGLGLNELLRLRSQAGEKAVVPPDTSVIQIWLGGGPSQFETFDPKPKLAQMHGKPMPESLTRGQCRAHTRHEKRSALRRRRSPICCPFDEGCQKCVELANRTPNFVVRFARQQDFECGEQLTVPMIYIIII